MFGPREMLLSSNEPVVRQFLNGQRQGPIGMAEEKDAGELAAEAAGGEELGKIPPIPEQLPTSDGRQRESQRAPGSWLREHGVVPPAGSFPGLDVELPQPSGDGRTGWTGERPPTPTSASAGGRPLSSRVPAQDTAAADDHDDADSADDIDDADDADDTTVLPAARRPGARRPAGAVSVLDEPEPEAPRRARRSLKPAPRRRSES